MGHFLCSTNRLGFMQSSILPRLACWKKSETAREESAIQVFQTIDCRKTWAKSPVDSPWAW
uniref:Uncharacterized protein n=1 Tax=Anguilla anguilla TaxID=7936 RepID=A0A0E9QR27_ANGAN